MKKMSNEKHETIADIVTEMRKRAEEVYVGQSGYPESWKNQMDYGEIYELADRIEAAHKREHEEVAVSKMETTTPTREKSSAAGNTAAMREALDKIADMGEQIDYQLGSSDETVFAFRNERSLAHSISECARTALSAPPRNCDVGTPEEQSARFDAHCRKHMGCLTCPLREKDGGVPKHCEFAWSQMPYDEVK